MYSVVGSDGAVYGPVDLATIRAWIAQGRVTAATSLIEPLSGRVVLAGQCVDLHDAFPPSSPPIAGQMNPGPYSAPVGSAYPRVQPSSGYSTGPPGAVTPWYTLYAPVPMGVVVVPASPRSKIVAILLALFLWPFGIHRFYLGYSGIGVLMLLSNLLCWWVCYIPPLVFGILAVIDIIMIATGGLRDAEGRPLTN